MVTEPFLLDPASEAFLASNRERVPHRLRTDNDLPLLVLAVVGCLFFLVTTILQVVDLLTRPIPQGNLQNLMTSLAILASLSFLIVWKLKSNSKKAKLVRDGKLLTGNILNCRARKDGNGEMYWQTVRVDYEFDTPQQKTFTAHWERDRDDLDISSLPEMGRSVHVLYVNEQSYLLL